MYLAARAKVMGKSLGLMAEATAQTLLEAYERAGQPLDQTTLQEITDEINQFCEEQRKHLHTTANSLASQLLAGTPQNQPNRLAESLAAQMETELPCSCQGEAGLSHQASWSSVGSAKSRS
jgi:hypothetical protein